MTVELNCPECFANASHSSVVQGGIVSAILDDVTWMALQCELMQQQSSLTPTVSIEIKTSYLKPTPVGALRARGRVLQLGGSIAFVEGTVYHFDEKTYSTPLAQMSSTVRVFRK